MKITDVLKVTEELLYQLLLWIVLVPKTLIRVIREPAWPAEYVAAEHEKPTEERFDDYMPPILFLVVVGIIPNIIANVYWPTTPYTDFFTNRNIVSEATSLNTELRILLYGAIWMLMPMCFSIVQHLNMRKQITKAAFRPTFEMHCMKVAPIALVFLVRFFFLLNLDIQAKDLFWLNILTIFIAFSWLLYSDIALSRMIFGVGWGKAALLAIIAIILYYIIIGPVVLAVNSVQ